MTFESTNIWDYKPWWCQPWSIILTGVTAISGSWLILHTLWISMGVAVVMAAWWSYFLVIYPKTFAKYIASQQIDFGNVSDYEAEETA